MLVIKANMNIFYSYEELLLYMELNNVRELDMTTYFCIGELEEHTTQKELEEFLIQVKGQE